MVKSLNRGLIAFALLIAGLVLLAIGGFIQFDPDGRGAEGWRLPLGYFAAVLGIAAVVVAWPEPKARLRLGAALAGLSIALIVIGLTVTSFRFVWARDEFELAAFEFLLLVLATILAGTALALRLRADWPLRIIAYVAGTTVLTYAVFRIGTAYYDRTMCNPDDSTDCLALLGGMFWGAGAAALCLVAVVVIEVVRWRRRSAAAVGR